MGDDITIGVTEIVNNIEVTAQPNDQIVDISVTDNADNVTLNITPTVIEINVNKGSSFAQWGDLYGTLSDQTDLQNALNLKANLVDGKVPASELPSYVDDIIEVANYAALPATGEIGKIYVTLDNNKIYRWSGSVYIEIASNSAIWGAITGTLSSQIDLQNALNAKEATITAGTTAQYWRGDKSWQTLDKTAVGLGNVDNTSDLNKPISTATQTALNGKFNNPTGNTTQYIAGDGSLITFPVAGQSGTLVREVRNTSGATLTKGTVVYINGANGNKPTVAKAIATGDSTSAQTFGIIQADLANNANGYVVCVGDIVGLDTSAITEGTQLYLSSTTAGAYTTTKQLAPAHLVYIGIVTRSHPTLGQIEVKIQNGYELDEIHDVAISSKANNQILAYESATDLWKNKSIATVLGYTPANDASVVKVTTDQNVRGIKTFLGDQTATTLKLIVADYYNDGFITSDNGMLRLLNGTTELFNLASTGDLTAKSFVKSGGTSSQYLMADGSVSTGSGGTVTGTGTTNYIPKFTGASAIGNSLIYDDGTNVGIGTTSPSASLDVVSNSGASGINIRARINNDYGALNFKSYDDAEILSQIYINRTSANVASLIFNTNNGGFATERMRITSGGNVGIGTTSPSGAAGTALAINGQAGQTRIALKNNFTGDNPSDGFQILLNAASADVMLENRENGYIGFATNDAERMRITSGGRLLLGQTSDFGYLLQVNGTSYFQGNALFNQTVTATGFFNSSDNRLKDLIDYDYNVSDIKPITYLWKDGRDDKKHVGYSAQEVQKVMPDAVNEGTDGMLSVNYVEILVAKISQMEKEIAYLKSKL